MLMYFLTLRVPVIQESVKTVQVLQNLLISIALMEWDLKFGYKPKDVL